MERPAGGCASAASEVGRDSHFSTTSSAADSRTDHANAGEPAASRPEPGTRTIAGADAGGPRASGDGGC